MRSGAASDHTPAHGPITDFARNGAAETPAQAARNAVFALYVAGPVPYLMASFGEH
jgi:hypothetical protein